MNNLVISLNELGVKDIYFCAGARNSSLIEDLSSFNQIFSLDERSAAFMALGHAKLLKKPVAICVTSGTAVAECLPAVIEAYYSHTPVIVISADRPERLQNTFAPQTIKQDGIFTTYARYEFNGPKEKLFIDNPSYPMHLNIHIDSIREHYSKPSGVLSLIEFEKLFNAKKRPIAIFTEGRDSFEKEFHFLNELKIPIHLECTSTLKISETKNPIYFENTLVNLFKANKIDLILKFGGTPISKLWRLLDSKEHEVDVISYKNEKVGLPFGYVLDDDLMDSIHLQYSSSEKIVEKDLNELLRCFPLSEPAMMNNIVDNIAKEDFVFVGNSMPIRYFQMLHPIVGQRRVYAARGANGIDGQISMAIGMASATNKAVHCIIGDLTFLYDLGISATKLPTNIFIHIINNKGGRIFEHIDVHPKMILAHDYHLMDLIKGFVCKDQIREYIPDPDQTKQFWQHWKS